MWTAVELRELRVFLALADELHFGRTAERLQISQPGVSAAIRSLEGHLGVRLFDRTSRRVTLTPAGQELRCTIGPILGELQDALARASDLAVGLGGELCIGITSTTHGPPLSRLLAAFRSQHPECQVILHEVDSGDPYAALRRGEADVLVNWFAVDEPDLTAGPVIALHDRVLVVARGHHLAARTSVLLEDLGDEQVTLLPPTFPPALCDAILLAQLRRRRAASLASSLLISAEESGKVSLGSPPVSYRDTSAPGPVPAAAARHRPGPPVPRLHPAGSPDRTAPEFRNAGPANPEVPLSHLARALHGFSGAHPGVRPRPTLARDGLKCRLRRFPELFCQCPPPSSAAVRGKAWRC